MNKVAKGITILVSLVLIAAAGLVAMLAFPVFGNQALIVRSGSMEPSIGIGSVVVVRPSETNKYNVGDVIAFRYDSSTIITHRITAIEKNGNKISYQTKGDANEEKDNWTVAQSDIIGQSIHTIPEFGKILAFARSDKGFPLLIILPAIVVILLESITIFREVRKRIREERLKKNPDINPLKYFPSFGFQRLTDIKSSNISGVLLIPLFVLGFTIQGTYAFFSDTETSPNNIFQAAATFPSPSTSPTPTGEPSNNPCDNINVDISGNGVGSYNGAIIFCINHKVVNQINETNISTEIITETNTGNNTSSGNTGGDNNTETGDTNTNVNVVVEGSSNTNSATPSPTLTPTNSP